MTDKSINWSNASYSDVEKWIKSVHQCGCGSYNVTPDAIILPWSESNFTCNVCGVRF